MPFTTWTFDSPCREMELNRIATASMEAIGPGDVTVSSAAVDDADLVVLGVYGPPSPKDSKDGDADGDDEDADVDVDVDVSVPEPTLTGKAKEMDEALGGALTETMVENYKAFKHGANAGGTTPTLRIASNGNGSNGSKVSRES